MPEEREETKGSGKRLGGFELISKIGHGGMGVVYKARQLSMNRLVALKILPPRLAKDREFIGRFMREAQAVARLNHPNVVQGIDAGEVDGFYYFAMEYVPGETVHSIILREGALDERRALGIARDIARALDHAQKHGLVHRDIKPGNIIVTTTGVAKLCDLGLARELDTVGGIAARGNVAIGTPYYISPEQARGEETSDIRSDIYSLGATLYRAVVGEPPFAADTPAEILAKQVSEPLPWPSSVNPKVSDAVSHLIARMMAKNPQERYQTAAELEQDLDRILEGKRPLSADMEFAVPPVVVPERSRAERKGQALRELYEVRQAAKEAAREQKVTMLDLPRVLHGNLDEARPETFVKYALLALSEGSFELARRHFRQAHALGGQTEKLAERMSILATPRGMIYIPEGESVLGPPGAEQKVKCGAYYIDIYPVINREYARFLAAADYPAPKYWGRNTPPEGSEEHPVVGVSWDDARTYALWAGKELPSSLQWERAARGNDARIWPWGSVFQSDRCNTKEAGVGGTTSVGAYPAGASPFGCVDMAGDVREWLGDVATGDSNTDQARDRRFVAGGSWDDSQEQARSFHREKLDRKDRDLKTGFRCVKPL